MFKTLRINYVNKYFNTSALLGLLWDKKSSQNALVFCSVEKLPARSWQRASVSLLVSFSWQLQEIGLLEKLL